MKAAQSFSKTAALCGFGLFSFACYGVYKVENRPGVILNNNDILPSDSLILKKCSDPVVVSSSIRFAESIPSLPFFRGSDFQDRLRTLENLPNEMKDGFLLKEYLIQLFSSPVMKAEVSEYHTHIFPSELSLQEKTMERINSAGVQKDVQPPKDLPPALTKLFEEKSQEKAGSAVRSVMRFFASYQPNNPYLDPEELDRYLQDLTFQPHDKVFSYEVIDRSSNEILLRYIPAGESNASEPSFYLSVRAEPVSSNFSAAPSSKPALIAKARSFLYPVLGDNFRSYLAFQESHQDLGCKLTVAAAWQDKELDSNSLSRPWYSSLSRFGYWIYSRHLVGMSSNSFLDALHNRKK